MFLTFFLLTMPTMAQDEPDFTTDEEYSGFLLPFEGTGVYQQKGHNRSPEQDKVALDFYWGKKGTIGHPLLAAKGGVVVHYSEHAHDDGASCDAGWPAANNITIGHGGVDENGEYDHYSIYWHLKQNSVPNHLNIGSLVHVGQKIGEIGNSGKSDFAHLHFIVATKLNILPYTLSGECGYTGDFEINSPQSESRVKPGFEEFHNNQANLDNRTTPASITSWNSQHLTNTRCDPSTAYYGIIYEHVDYGGECHVLTNNGIENLTRDTDVNTISSFWRGTTSHPQVAFRGYRNIDKSDSPSTWMAITSISDFQVHGLNDQIKVIDPYADFCSPSECNHLVPPTVTEISINGSNRSSSDNAQLNQRYVNLELVGLTGDSLVSAVYRMKVSNDWVTLEPSIANPPFKLRYDLCDEIRTPQYIEFDVHVVNANGEVFDYPTMSGKSHPQAYYLYSDCPPETPPTKVTFYPGSHYEEQVDEHQVFSHSVGSYDVSAKNRIWSMKIPTGYSVILYRDPDQQGKSKCFSHDVNNLVSHDFIDARSFTIFSTNVCDHEKPEVEFSFPLSTGDYIQMSTNDDLVLHWYAKDNVELASVDIALVSLTNGNKFSLAPSQSVSGNHFPATSWIYSQTYPADEYIVIASASDTSGNIFSSAVSVSIYEPIPPPTKTASSPPDGFCFNESLWFVEDDEFPEWEGYCEFGIYGIYRDDGLITSTAIRAEALRLLTEDSGFMFYERSCDAAQFGGQMIAAMFSSHNCKDFGAELVPFNQSANVEAALNVFNDSLFIADGFSIVFKNEVGYARCYHESVILDWNTHTFGYPSYYNLFDSPTSQWEYPLKYFIVETDFCDYPDFQPHFVFTEIKGIPVDSIDDIMHFDPGEELMFRGYGQDGPTFEKSLGVDKVDFWATHEDGTNVLLGNLPIANKLITAFVTLPETPGYWTIETFADNVKSPYEFTVFIPPDNFNPTPTPTPIKTTVPPTATPTPTSTPLPTATPQPPSNQQQFIFLPLLRR